MSDRITTRFGGVLAQQIDAWAQSNGYKTRSEALRVLATQALANGPQGAFTAAYDQALAELRDAAWRSLERAQDELSKGGPTYGGKGPFRLPRDHVAGMKVPEGGSSCANCMYLGRDGASCTNTYWITWNGGNPRLPFAASEFCSDWWTG